MRRPQRSRGAHEHAIGRVVNHTHSLAHHRLAWAGRRPGAVLRGVDADAHPTLARPPTHHRTETVPDTLSFHIHANPVRRGLAHKPCDWPWSSARWYERREGLTIDALPL
jgi:hypothetical protein